jgi:hypothetical protein
MLKKRRIIRFGRWIVQPRSPAPPNTHMNPTEPRQVLVGIGVGFVVWWVVTAVGWQLQKNDSLKAYS